jgi:hypothetical protein
MRYDHGEGKVWSVVRVPTVEQRRTAVSFIGSWRH